MGGFGEGNGPGGAGAPSTHIGIAFSLWRAVPIVVCGEVAPIAIPHQRTKRKE